MADKLLHFSNKFELDGIQFEEPVPNLFSFNNPFGACPACEGFGKVLGIDADLVIPDKRLSVYEGAVAPWKGEKMGLWKEHFIKAAKTFRFSRSYTHCRSYQRTIQYTYGKAMTCKWHQ